MQQLVALLTANAAETFDQRPRTCDGMLPDCKGLRDPLADHQNDALMIGSEPPPSIGTSAGRNHDVAAARLSAAAENSPFSIESILSSRRNHGDERQHQQPDTEHLRRYEIAADSSSVYHNRTPLPALPLTHAFYGQCS